MSALALVCAIGGASCASGAPVEPEALDGYRVVYSIEDRPVDGRVRDSVEIVSVRRPYDGRVETRLGSDITSGRVTSREYFWQLGRGGSLSFGVVRSPGGPARDTSLVAVRDAVAAGRADEIGSAVVLGRPCAWFAYQDPAPQSLARPTRASRIESCVDAGGVVLREVWTLKGRTARVVEATSLVRSAPRRSLFLEGRAPETEHVSNPRAAGLVETQVLVKDVGAHEPSRFTLEVPKRWRPGRTAVIGSVPGRGAQPTQFLSRSFTHGHDLAIVETSSSPEFPPPWPTDQGTKIAIGEGEGRIVYYTDRVELRLLSGKGYARVVAPSRSLAFLFVRGLA